MDAEYRGKKQQEQKRQIELRVSGAKQELETDDYLLPHFGIYMHYKTDYRV